MERVKIFTGSTKNNFKGLELEVNEWFVKNDGIEITSRFMAITSGINIEGNDFVNCTIAVFYQQAK